MLFCLFYNNYSTGAHTRIWHTWYPVKQNRCKPCTTQEIMRHLGKFEQIHSYERDLKEICLELYTCYLFISMMSPNWFTCLRVGIKCRKCTRPCKISTEQVGLRDNASELYLGGPQFKCQPGNWIYSVLSGKFSELVPLMLSSKSFPIHYSLQSYHLNLYCVRDISNKPQTIYSSSLQVDIILDPGKCHMVTMHHRMNTARLNAAFINILQLTEFATPKKPSLFWKHALTYIDEYGVYAIHW
jgi:hypothetical protein